MRQRYWLAVVGVTLAIITTISQAQTNMYISTDDGFWDEARHWSLASAPSVSQSGILITNDTSKTVTIDSITSSLFSNTLTISNLIVSSSFGATNTLYLNNAGTLTALHVLDGLAIGSPFIAGFGPHIGALVMTNSALLVEGISGGALDAGGVISLADSTLIATSCTFNVGGIWDSGASLIASNCMIQARDVTIGGSGGDSDVEIVGGTMHVASSLALARGSASGTLRISNGGLCIVTNGTTSIGDGSYSDGTIVVSNATLLASDISLDGYRSTSSLLIDAGTVTLRGALYLANSSSQVFLNGGLLAVTNDETVVGEEHGYGAVTVSNGLFLARDVFVGSELYSEGAFMVHGGIAVLSSNLQIGSGLLSLAHVEVTAGQLIVTNANMMVANPLAWQGGSDPQIVVSGGQLAARAVGLGTFGFFASCGTLTVNGGSVTVSAGMTLGDCATNHVGWINMLGGELLITNSGGTAFMDVRNGQVVLSNGVLQIDKLVMTNSCGSFIRSGGTLIVGNLVLDPNLSAVGDGIPNGWKQQYGFDPLDPNVANMDSDGDGFSNSQEYLAGTNPTNAASAFRILSVARENSNLRVTWSAVGGHTNIVQAASSLAGSYSDVSSNIVIPGTSSTTTNYLDIGAVTNSPARFYRVRLVP